MITYHPDSDSWHVPILPLRKDELRARKGGGGVYRPHSYADRKKAFQAALAGYHGPRVEAIPSPKRKADPPRRRNVHLTVWFHPGTPDRMDMDNALSFLMDALNGVAWDDDWQVGGVTMRVGTGEPGLQFRVKETGND